MNQGLYFGQMVIGPAGSGKVLRVIMEVDLLQAYAGNGLNIEKKDNNCELRSSG